MLYLAGENLSLIDTFKKADEVLLNAVKGISDLINNTGHINADFADVATVMANKGLSLMGTGIASGESRAIKAAKEAISSPLLEDISIDGATGIIINISGSESLTMHETNEAVTLIMEAADEDAEIIFGTVIDPELGDDIKVTVIATGLGIEEEEEIKIEEAPKEEIIIKEEVKEEIRVEAPIIEEKIEDGMGDLARETHQQAEIISNTRISENIERPVTPAEKATAGVSRARTIAEKLGFVPYNEEELDTPTYLRAGHQKPDISQRTELN